MNIMRGLLLDIHCDDLTLWVASQAEVKMTQHCSLCSHGMAGDYSIVVFSLYPIPIA